jgi:hypothetical protein
MRHQTVSVALALLLSVATGIPTAGSQDNKDDDRQRSSQAVQLGPRPFFLINEMEDGSLKQQLQKCSAGPFRKSDFSIGHRGAPLQFPEHTRESYEAGARLARESWPMATTASKREVAGARIAGGRGTHRAACLRCCSTPLDKECRRSTSSR